jgi:hypothetical protein
MVWLLVSVLFADQAATKPDDSLADPGQIDGACDAAEEYANQHESAATIVADVSDAVLPKKGQGVWKAFRTTKELQGARRDGGAPNTQARVWIVPSGLTFVDAFFQSDSADWGHFVAYCYRVDGTLARTISTHNTFLEGGEDGIRGVRTRHYARDGKILQGTQQVLNLRTKKPLAKAKFPGAKEPLFFKREDLPFWSRVRPAN